MLKKIICSSNKFYRLRDEHKLEPGVVYCVYYSENYFQNDFLQSKDEDDSTTTYNDKISFIVRTKEEIFRYNNNSNKFYSWEIDIGKPQRDISFYVNRNKVSRTEFFDKIENSNKKDLEWLLWNVNMNDMTYIGMGDD